MDATGSMGLTEHEVAVTEWLAARRDEILALLVELVNIDSHTYDKAGVDAVGEVLAAFFRARGLPVDTIPREAFGDVIRATLRHDTAGDSPIVLMGHRDTVFPKGGGTPSVPHRERPRLWSGRRRHEGRARDECLCAGGPCGMRGHPGPVVALVTGDEEIASPASRSVIEAEARGARGVRGRAGPLMWSSAAARAVFSSSAMSTERRRIPARTTSAASPPSRNSPARSPLFIG